MLQRVSSASVEVEGETVASIGRGVLLLVGFRRGDDDASFSWMIEKICNLRIFPDEEGNLNRSLREVGGAVLCVSQFTLYGDCRKGRRPSFTEAAPSEEANVLYNRFVDMFSASYEGKVASGVFGAMMNVSLVNEGPVTLVLER